MRGRERIVAASASIYTFLILAAIVSLRFLGERWWTTGVGLYLPRLVLAAPLPVFVTALAAVGPRRYIWTQIVAAWLLLFPWMGFVLPWPSLHPRAEQVVRVLSYNIDSGVGGIPNIVAEIDRYSPDVVLLQELAGSELIAGLLETRYPTVRVTNQFLLASRYPVVSSVDPEKLDYEGRHRSARFVQQILETPLGHIAIYNMHPLSPREIFYALRGNGMRREILSGRLFSSANAAVFQANSGLRTLQVKAVADAAQQETDPVIIAGDTNLPGLSFVLNRYLSGYQDGFVQAGRGFGYTFPTNRGPWMRIDRILASQTLRFVRFEVGTSLASDHLCVIADLQLRSR
jgi:endonuclease/exonuclease/phosphatase (EEP) superfamily protein YafD